MDNTNNNVKECIACKTTFIRQSDMIRHIKRFHSKNAEALITMLENKTSLLENKTSLFKCDQCDKQFNNKKNLTFHRKSHCGNHSGVKIRKKCPLCDHVAAFKKDFYDHCRESHSITLDIEKMDFPSVDDFMNWKAEIEGAMNSKFVKEYGSTTKMTNYICNQSEYSVSGSDPEIGSSQDKKVNGFCPAGFRVMHEANGKCSIFFVKTHICYQNKNIFPTDANEMKRSDEKTGGSKQSENSVYVVEKNKSVDNNCDEEVNQPDHPSTEKKPRSIKRKEFLIKKREMMKNVLDILDTISNTTELEAVQELISPIKPILRILQSKEV